MYKITIMDDRDEEKIPTVLAQVIADKYWIDEGGISIDKYAKPELGIGVPIGCVVKIETLGSSWTATGFTGPINMFRRIEGGYYEI